MGGGGAAAGRGGAIESVRSGPGRPLCPEPTPARPYARGLTFPQASARHACGSGSAAFRLSGGLGRVSARLGPSEGLGRVSAGLGFSAGLGRCRRASAARRVSAALERVGGDSGRRLPQEAGRPRLCREDPSLGPAARPFSPSGNAFLRAASAAPA